MKHENSFHACHQKRPATAAAWRDAGGRLINQPLLQMMNTHARTQAKQKEKKNQNILANNCGSIEVKKQIMQNAEVKNGGAAHRVAPDICLPGKSGNWSWAGRRNRVCIIGFWNTGRPGASFVEERFHDSVSNDGIRWWIQKLLCTVTTQHFWEH